MKSTCYSVSDKYTLWDLCGTWYIFIVNTDRCVYMDTCEKTARLVLKDLNHA